MNKKEITNENLKGMDFERERRQKFLVSIPREKSFRAAIYQVRSAYKGLTALAMKIWDDSAEFSEDILAMGYVKAARKFWKNRLTQQV